MSATQVEPLSNITDMISGMAGVVDAQVCPPPMGKDGGYIAVELNGSHDAWITLADLRHSGAVIQFQWIEGVDGNSGWLLVITGSPAGFALALRDVVSAVQ